MRSSHSGGGDPSGAGEPGSVAAFGRGWLVAAFAAFAGYAGVVALVSGIGVHRQWAIIAAPAYLLAAVAALWRRRGLEISMALGVAGGLVAPLIWLAARHQGQRELWVIVRGARLLIQHGTPYESAAALAGTQNPDAYNPYLPVMAVFGMARAQLGNGMLTDPRIWLSLAFVVLFALALRCAGARDVWRWTALVTATPLVAFPLAVAGDDLPVLALMCLGLALLWQPGRRHGPLLAGVALGVAAGLKATAWLALVVALALLAARDGRRAVASFALSALAVFAVLVGPVAAAAPVALVDNTISFPLGLSHVKSGAASPLPGYLLAQTGHPGHLVAVGLLVLSGLAVALSLIIRPPMDCRSATWRLIIGLVLMFSLAPASRFGYYIYPAGLWVWMQVSSLGARATAEPGSPERGSSELTSGADAGKRIRG